MRPLAPPSALFASGVLAWGCAVYDTDLLASDSGLSGSGSSSSDGGRAGMANGGANSNAGNKPSNTAGKSTEGGTAGSAATEGGASGEENMGGEGPSGSGGSAGAGGNAGKGGSAGAGGGGGGGGGGGSGGKGGSAGSGGGGSPSTVKCSDHPLTLKSTWIPNASASSLGNGMESDGLYNPPSHLTDGLLPERWSSGKTQAGDEWIQVDFGAEVTLSQVTLQLGANMNDWPRAWAIRVSSDMDDFNAPVLASGTGSLGADVVVSLADPVSGRYLLVRQTGVNTTTTSWWTVAEVLVGCID